MALSGWGGTGVLDSPIWTEPRIMPVHAFRTGIILPDMALSGRGGTGIGEYI